MSSDQRSPLRAHRRLSARRTDAAGTVRVPARADTVREIERELEAWRAPAVPAPSTSPESDYPAPLFLDFLLCPGPEDADAPRVICPTPLLLQRHRILGTHYRGPPAS